MWALAAFKLKRKQNETVDIDVKDFKSAMATRSLFRNVEGSSNGNSEVCIDNKKELNEEQNETD